MSDHVEVLRNVRARAAEWADDTSIVNALDAAIAALSAPQPPSGGEVSEVTRQLVERDAAGRKKYGTTLDRTDLSHADWLQHMAEELLDAAGYALAAKRTAPPSAPVGVDAVPVAWIRASMVETSTGEVGHLVRVGSEQEHPDDVPLYLTQQPAAVDGALEGAALEVVESINRFRDEGARPHGGTLTYWEATLRRALAAQPGGAS